LRLFAFKKYSELLIEQLDWEAAHQHAYSLAPAGLIPMELDC